jgi:hypothetical protein
MMASILIGSLSSSWCASVDSNIDNIGDELSGDILVDNW